MLQCEKPTASGHRPRPPLPFTGRRCGRRARVRPQHPARRPTVKTSPLPSAGGSLRPFIVSPLAAVPTRKRGARGRRRGGQLRSAKFLFTPLATPPSARAVVRRGRCSRAARRSGGLLKKRAGGAGKAGKGVADGANKNLAERSRPPPCRLCLSGLETQQTTTALANDSNGPKAAGGRPTFHASGAGSMHCSRCAANPVSGGDGPPGGPGSAVRLRTGRPPVRSCAGASRRRVGGRAPRPCGRPGSAPG